MAAAAPKYRAEYVEVGSDRLRYTLTAPWPDPSRARLRLSFAENIKTVITFDNEQRPCDLPVAGNGSAPPPVAPPRRLTPKNVAVPIPDDLGHA